MKHTHTLYFNMFCPKFIFYSKVNAYRCNDILHNILQYLINVFCDIEYTESMLVFSIVFIEFVLTMLCTAQDSNNIFKKFFYSYMNKSYI